MATIRDVAQLAEVSTATVSHVINETRAVSDELRARVLQAMEQLSYRPNAVARSLRVSETMTVGLIVPDVEIPFFAKVALGIERAAHKAGYSVILCNSGWELTRELQYLENLLARQIDGLICISPSLAEEHIAPIVRRGTPVVWFEEMRTSQRGDAVTIDNVKGAYEGTCHLLDLGHRRIGCIPGLVHAKISSDRLIGFRRALSDYGVIDDAALYCAGDYTTPSGRQAAQYLLGLPTRPTAIFAFNDMMAIGALQIIGEAGLRVPHDVAVLGFDGISLTESTSPPLSTIAQPTDSMTQMAIAMLLDRINSGFAIESRRVMVEPRLVVRASTVGYAGTARGDGHTGMLTTRK